MPTASPAFVDPNLLAGFSGLTHVMVTSALTAGAIASRACTANHPKTAGGFYFYAETVRVLRDTTGPAGWKAESDSNIEYIIDPTGSVRLFVLAGDAETGLPDGNPRSRHGRGAYGSLTVHANQLVLEMPDLVESSEFGPSLRPPAWALLHFYDRRKQEIQHEISLPTTLLDDGRVCGWERRIVFEPIRLGDVRIPERPNESRVEVEIHRRAGL